MGPKNGPRPESFRLKRSATIKEVEQSSSNFKGEQQWLKKSLKTAG
ncbi:hypothetical protein [Jeotgalibacillus salarius]|nr:hypothetical protein [Jeotgalibacillus salarius]